MTIFEYVTVAVSIILGLAFAQLLSSASDLVIFRRRITFHWIPMIWALSLFCVLTLFWWQLFQVSQLLEEWAILDFGLAICIATAFFMASALMLPKHWDAERVDLYHFFQDHGRWGVGTFALVMLITIPLNFRLFGVPLFSGSNMFLAADILTASLTVWSRSKLMASVWTFLFAANLTAELIYIVVPAY